MYCHKLIKFCPVISSAQRAVMCYVQCCPTCTLYEIIPFCKLFQYCGMHWWIVLARVYWIQLKNFNFNCSIAISVTFVQPNLGAYYSDKALISIKVYIAMCTNGYKCSKIARTIPDRALILIALISDIYCSFFQILVAHSSSWLSSIV